MAFSIVYWRFGIPIYRSLRHGLRVDRVVVEAPGIISVIMRGRNLQTLAAQGGQFFGWRFLAKGHALDFTSLLTISSAYCALPANNC